ncbi:MAG: NAD(P)-binding protein [Candidatus Accumulibacter sp.]|jgi:glycine/D-amino acid oxidase-like deaminating enzyme|nr:NAD(P)-binding protein [Accumulibacter sp.]
MSMDRRKFLGRLAAGLTTLSACGRSTDSSAPPLPPGDFIGTSPDIGHLLRVPGLPPARETQRVPVVVVGAGIGGLSAAWKLAKSGFRDFLLLELEASTGGNSRSGRNAVSEFPLAAHYLPLPTPEATATRELLSELGVLEGDPHARQPRYDERYLCAAPQERLYYNGLWRDGLLPLLGVSGAEQKEYRRFFDLMKGFKTRRDGRSRAFALPMALSSDAPDLRALDRATMRDWMLSQGFTSEHLHWYVDYACRDDYGTSSAEVSAWAGIHYFSCRSGEAKDAASDAVLTTPGGNAWLAEGLARSIRSNAGDRFLNGALVFRVEEKDEGWLVDVWRPEGARSLRIEAKQLIWAAPAFLVPYIFTGNEDAKRAGKSFSYAPWLVANLTLSRVPASRPGAPLSWDNVLYDSPGLGYVAATHQHFRQSTRETVLTYYRAFSRFPPQVARQNLLAWSREECAETVLEDLERAHPDLRQLCTRLDVTRIGHAMARPTPGSIWGPARRLLAADGTRLRFAHSDVSGFSLFEEAQYRGVLAAERTLRRLGKRFVSSLV